MITDHLRNAHFSLGRAHAEFEHTQRERTDAALGLIDGDLAVVEGRVMALRAAIADEIAQRAADPCIWCGRTDTTEEILAAEASGYQIAIADAKVAVAGALDPKRRGWSVPLVTAEAAALAALDGLRGHAPGCSAENPCCADHMDVEPG